MRLDRFVCKSTHLAKQEAIACIKNGFVIVNGNIVKNEALQVHENNVVTLQDKPLRARPFRYILMNKPANTICSNVDEHFPSLFKHLHIENLSELHIAGRLDADTTGLVLITDDGRWTYNITHPNSMCPKTYRVHLKKEITQHYVEMFKNGIQLQGEEQATLPATLHIVSPKEVLLTITEGKFHQVKRMFKALGNKVISLHRESIGAIYVDVAIGDWRYLTAEEVALFK